MNARQFLHRETGLNLSDAVAERALSERMAALGLRDSAAYLRDITPDELTALVDLVVVPESWMFRDADAFTALVRFVRERLAARPGRTVRILSVPCAGGEEPYTIAMALQDGGVARSAVIIEAVDLSQAALERARLGRYTRNAFRGGDLAFRERHFTQDGDEFQISQALRDQVNFRQGNLLAVDTASNGRYDVVFCRNLLIYFDAATTASAIARLRLLLDDDGILFAGYAEVPSFCRHGFTPLRSPGAFALQKERRAELRIVPGRVPPPAPPATRVAPAATAPKAAAAAPRAKPAATPQPPDPAALLEQARRLADQGDYADAAAACQALLKADPDSAEAYFILGMVSDCQQKPGVADDYWRRCVYLQPDHYEALCHLALLAEQNGDAAQAASFKQRAARVYGRRENSAARKRL